MDPQTCLYELLESLLDGDRDFALAHLDALREWIAKDEFLPEVAVCDHTLIPTVLTVSPPRSCS